MDVSGSPRPVSVSRAAFALILLGLLGCLATLRADLLPDLLPNLLPPLDRECLALGLFSLLSGIASVTSQARKSAWPQGRPLGLAILIGLGFFVVPTMLSEPTVGWISPITRAALFTLTPFFALIFAPYIMQEAGRQNGVSLPAAILAAAGTMLALPISMPASLPAIASFGAIGLAAACVAATTCLAVAVFHPHESASRAREPAPGIASFAAIATATACLGIGAIAAFREPHSWHLDALPSSLGWEAAIELPALLLFFWLIPRTTAPRIATRFTLTLLFPILIGAPLLGSHLTLRDWIGVAMMAAGTAYLLLARDQEPDSPGLSLR